MKQNKLKVWYSIHEKDIVGVVDDQENRPDLNLMFLVFAVGDIYGFPKGTKLYKELEKRGYDLSTLKFEIKKKAEKELEEEGK